MAAISDSIEKFIVSMLDEEDGVELKRNELAQYFGCAPSQINYVLTTRFSVERGYVITSRRGGGGCIWVTRIKDGGLQEVVTEHIGAELTLAKARAIIDRLLENQVLSGRESQLMLAAVMDSAMIPTAVRDHVRANTLKNMLMAMMK